MTGRRGACFALLAGIGLAGGCGEELAEREAERPASPVPVCELIDASDLQQIFVDELTLDVEASTADSCAWKDAETGEAFLEYEVLPYSEDLHARVQALRAEQDGETEQTNVRTVKGIGDAAIWTDLGLFVNRNGRTLRIAPADPDGDRAPYQELARLLLTRMEAG